MRYRLTYENKEGTRFSYIEEPDEKLQEGEWEEPFPPNSTAFSLVGELVASDRCPIDFFDSPVVSLKVRKLT